MKRILSVVGTRPQIIKAAAVSRAFAAEYASEVTELLVHTGQHYDANMSQVFFDELGMVAPAYHLESGSGTHIEQLTKMMQGLATCVAEVNPDAILLYGDTNSTLAGALVGSKMRIPIIHVEAGLRSFNKKMPEENNRIIADHASTILFAPTDAAVENLRREGFSNPSMAKPDADHPLVVKCGDVMFDNALYFASSAGCIDVSEFGALSGAYILATIHRDNNTDQPERLHEILDGLKRLAQSLNTKVIVPAHPRLASGMSPALLESLKEAGIRLIPPVSYIHMQALLEHALLVCTDSGGLQKEAYFKQRPCVILRPETEWVELVDGGYAVIADANASNIVRESLKILAAKPAHWPQFYGDGKASQHICSTIIQNI